MQQNNPNHFYHEDEIKLNEIINRLIASKKIIIITTLICTVIATGYVNYKPTYIAESVIKVGFYLKNNNTQGDFQTTRLPINNANQIINTLSMQFIELPKFKDEMISLSSIEEVPIAKVAKNKIDVKYEDLDYIILRATAKSPNHAAKKIESAQTYLLNDHQKKLDAEINRIELLIIESKDEVDYLKDSLKLLKIKNSDTIFEIEKQINEGYEELEYSKQDIAIQKQYLELYNAQRLEIENVLSSTAPSNPTLAAIRSIEKRDLGALIANGSLTLNQMNKDRINIETAILAKEKLIFESENNIFLLEMKYQEQALEKQIEDKLNEIIQLELIKKNENYMNSYVFSETKTEILDNRKLLKIFSAFLIGLILALVIIFLKQVFPQTATENTR